MQLSGGQHYIAITYETHPPNEPKVARQNTEEREQLGATVSILTAD
jgi:hypothetical protein